MASLVGPVDAVLFVVSGAAGSSRTVCSTARAETHGRRIQQGSECQKQCTRPIVPLFHGQACINSQVCMVLVLRFCCCSFVLTICMYHLYDSQVCGHSQDALVMLVLGHPTCVHEIMQPPSGA